MINRRLFLAGLSQIALLTAARAADPAQDQATLPVGSPPPPTGSTAPLPRGQLSNPNASIEAQRLYQFLCATDGQKTLTGQQEAAFDGHPRAELDYIQHCSGKLPAILGLDYITPSDNDNVNDRATRWYHEERGIPTLCWHWGAPDVGPGYDNAKHSFDLEAALTDGTPQNRAMMRDLDIIAGKLRVLRDRQVPVLWRPLHEFSGTWFWWGQHGPETFKRLWVTLYDLFTHHYGLNNLIWVLGYTSNVDPAYYPGRAYVDIAGADNYIDNHDPQAGLYRAVRGVVGDSVPVAMHENGPIPDPLAIAEQNAPWLYFMTWHTRYIKDPSVNTPDVINASYHDPRFLTKDALPAAIFAPA